MVRQKPIPSGLKLSKLSKLSEAFTGESLCCPVGEFKIRFGSVLSSIFDIGTLTAVLHAFYAGILTSPRAFYNES